MSRKADYRPTALRSFVMTLAIIAFVEIAVMEFLAASPGIPGRWGTLLDVVLLALASAPLIWFLVVKPLWRAIVSRDREVIQSKERMRAVAASHEVNSQILRALDMALTEPEIMDVAERSIAHVTPDRPAEILMADSSRAHLGRTMAVPAETGAGCPVATPEQCPAVRGGHSLMFHSDDAIDACPKLREHEQRGISAVCVPVSVLGRASGVMHVTGTEGDLPDEDAIERLNTLGAGIGSRMSMVRALADSQLQAQVDALTGLLNRRSLEEQVAVFDRSGRPYAVVTFDLDHFKNINDTYGHAAGDQALRLFSRALRETARSGDLVCRYGGEEFVSVLPDAAAASAAAMGERLRVHLLSLLAAGSVPAFTVSGGVADTSLATGFKEILGAADASLFLAKAEGRDRIEIATVTPLPAGAPQEPESA